MKMKKTMVITVTLSYLCLILLANLLPLNSSSMSLSDPLILDLKSEHLLHAIAYMPVAFLLYFLFHSILGSFRYVLIMSILGGCMFSMLTEYAQYYLSYRAFSFNDLFANSIGVVLGSLVLIVFRKAKKIQFSLK